MSVKPGYITGASAKVKIFGKTLAYCTDVSYSVSVQTIPIESMGKFEVHSNEPVAYSVDGSFSIIRYAKQASTLVGGDAAANGNAPGQVGDSSAGYAKGHLDPSAILNSSTFDLEIYQKQALDSDPLATGIQEIPVVKVADCRIVRRGGVLSKRGVLVENYAFVGVLLHDGTGDTADLVANSGETDLS